MSQHIETTGDDLAGNGPRASHPPSPPTSKVERKLDLELENLEKRNKWESYSPLLPLIASALTLTGLVFAFWQFLSLQRKAVTEQQYARAARLQDQLRSDVDKILGFAQEQKETISMVSFLLKDMQILIKEGKDIPNDDLKQEFNDSERRVTEALVQQIVNDTDFEKKPRDLVFAAKIVANWPDYQLYLKEEKPQLSLRRILANYVTAMQKFRQTNGPYLDQVKYHKASNVYEPPPDSDSTLFQTLDSLLVGFREHLNLMSGTPAEKEQFRSPFLAQLNEGLVTAIFGPPNTKR